MDMKNQIVVKGKDDRVKGTRFMMWMPKELYKHYDKIAKMQGVSMQEVLRQILSQVADKVKTA